MALAEQQREPRVRARVMGVGIGAGVGVGVGVGGRIRFSEVKRKVSSRLALDYGEG